MRVLHDNREIILGQTKAFNAILRSGEICIMRATVVGITSTGFVLKYNSGEKNVGEKNVESGGLCWTLEEMVEFVRIQNKDWIPNE